MKLGGGLLATSILALCAVPGATSCTSEIPCYSGPPRTDQVGACRPGTRSCEGYDCACEGEVTPKRERCGVKEDTNCDGFFCGDTEWTFVLGGPFDVVAVDDHQNTWPAGTSLVPVPPEGKYEPGDVFLAATFDTNPVQAIAVGADGGPVVTGVGQGSYWLGGPMLDGLVFVAKLEPSLNGPMGPFTWGVSCGGSMPSASGKAGGIGVAIDRAGDVIMVGTFAGTANCGDAPHASAGGADILLVKLSGSDGQVRWSQSFGDADDQSVAGVAVDANGNIFITGAEKGTTSFGGAPLSGGAFYVARFSPEGQHTWSAHFGAPDAAGPKAITMSATGPVIAGDYPSAGLDLGGGALPTPPPPGTGVFVLQLDGDGAPVWSRGFVTHTSTGAELGGMIFGADDTVVIAGSFGAELDFGKGPINPGGLAKASFIAGLDDRGETLWSRSIGVGAAPSFTTLTGIARGPAGEMVLAGAFDGTVDFGAGPVSPLSGVPGPQGVVLELAPP
jgi:hypothetical protein